MVISAANTGNPYQAVFIDWRMPGLDGWETSSRIRQWAPKGRSPIIVMVTVHDREDLAQKPDHEQSLLDAYLVKPVTASMLREAVSGVKASESAPRRPSDELTSGMPRRLEGMSILLVEDNPNNQQVALELLKDEGAKVELAGNGLEAVQCMLKADGAYDIVLMDIQMPVMDGLTAAIRMRELLEARTPPIVAMTANAQEGDREDSLAAGMVDHVAKPFDLDKLVSTLQKHTKRLSQSSHREATVALLPEVEALAKDLGIDMKAAVARLGGRQDVYRRLLVSFSKDLADAPQQIDEWWQKGNVAEIKYWLHTIKGLAATLGYQTLADVLIKAEGRLASESAMIDGQGWLDDAKIAVGAAPDGLAKLIDVMSSMSTQEAQPTTKAPINVSDLIDRLKALLELLGRSDMRALDLFDDLQTQFQSTNGFDWAPMSEAMLQLDFEQAATSCRQAITQLTKE
jgi:CheY-like chemotaxis protein/HPt (histidine-containing phosphotransfer) domain-containing protein